MGILETESFLLFDRLQGKLLLHVLLWFFAVCI